MGRHNTDSAQVLEEARLAMRELWLAADTFARDNNVYDGLNDQIIAAEAESGVRVERIMDALSISATVTKTVGGVACDCELMVEFGPDMRDMPDVWEGWQNNGRSGTRTLPRRDFPEVAHALLRMLPQESPA